MVAEGTSPTSFTKVEGWELTPPAELGQKNDFRDPQAYYNEEKGVLELTVTAAQGGVARVVKFTMAKDLKGFEYEGVILTDPTGAFWNLECSDTFRLGDRWYITYSGQDDTLWYASSENRYGPYDEPRRIDGKLFYAAKHVEDGENSYMVGWARRSESPSSTQEVSAWGGNLIVQQLAQGEDGSLILKPVEAYSESFVDRRELRLEGETASVTAGARYSFTEAFTSYERFLITGEFSFTGTGSFGLAFDFNGREDKYKLISLNPADGTLSLVFNEGSTPITETAVTLEAGKTYSFTYLQEGSVGTFYVDGQAALTVRLYGVSGKSVRLFAENNTVEWTNLREYTLPQEVAYEAAA
jgi:sucrose-6-phosphate hydrolase SacC (GH32 family)